MYPRYPTLWIATCLATLTHGSTAVGAGEKTFHLRYRVPPTPSVSCGIDCLYVGLRLSGKEDVTLAFLEKELPLGPHGISVEAMAESGRRRNVTVTTIRTSLDAIAGCGNPTVLHVNSNHFVVLLGSEDGRLVLFDNGVGLFDCTPDYFLARYKWEGVALVFGPLPPSILLSLHGPALALLFGGLTCFCLVLRSAGSNTQKGRPPCDGSSPARLIST